MKKLQKQKKEKFNLTKDLLKNYVLYLMVLPSILYFLIFQYAPMFGIVLAFKNFNYNDGMFGSPWVGFENFRFLFTSGTLLHITGNTIAYNTSFLIVSLILQVGTAILLSELASKWYKKVAQSLMFLPYFVSYVLLAAFVYNVFSYENGMLNGVLKQMGMQPIDVYGMEGAWKYILNFFYQWKGLGYGVVVYLAAITGISEEYYEASKIDGASKLQEIRYITLPLLKPTIIILTLFAVGKIMRGQFDLFYQIIGNNGQLFNATDIIDTYVFRMLTKSFDVGMGTAAGLYQSVFGFVLIVVVNWVVKRANPEYALF